MTFCQRIWTTRCFTVEGVLTGRIERCAAVFCDAAYFNIKLVPHCSFYRNANTYGALNEENHAILLLYFPMT